MRIAEAKFTRRYNVGNYEHEEYSLSSVFDDKDQSAVEALRLLKEDVAAAFSGKSDTAKMPKKKKAAPVEAADESEEDTEAEEIPATEDSESSSDSDEDDDQDTSSKTKTTSGATSATSKTKKFKKKAQVYQRSNETHKEIFSSVMTKATPDWKKTTESKAKAKNTSMKMEGKDFLDEDGEVLKEFSAEVKKLMASKK